jgi:hypothetical protein
MLIVWPNPFDLSALSFAGRLKGRKAHRSIFFTDGNFLLVSVALVFSANISRGRKCTDTGQNFNPIFEKVEFREAWCLAPFGRDDRAILRNLKANLCEFPGNSSRGRLRYLIPDHDPSNPSNASIDGNLLVVVTFYIVSQYSHQCQNPGVCRTPRL